MKIRRSVLDAIAAHARRDAPHECCGLLIGDSGEVLEAVPARNVAEDPLRRYEVSAEDHFAVIRRCRDEYVASGLSRKTDAIGVYHSHPHSAPVPSPTDLELAFTDFLFVIAGPVDTGAAPDIRAYRVKDGAFEEIGLEPVPDLDV